jgi:radical SAM-linked protein
MPRALFEKVGSARFISHLDLMRLFQRAFKRAGLPLTHTQGFNPRPSVSIALPLSLGAESHCELLDFDLESPVPLEDIRNRLNAALIDGIRVREVYDNGAKIKYLALLQSRLTLEYDGGIPAGAEAAIGQLFAREALVLEKKNRNGVTKQDIIPMIRNLEISRISEGELRLDVLHCCQNPSLNPMQLGVAIEKYLPELTPDYIRVCREEIYTEDKNVFR